MLLSPPASLSSGQVCPHYSLRHMRSCMGQLLAVAVGSVGRDRLDVCEVCTANKGRIVLLWRVERVMPMFLLQGFCHLWYATNLHLLFIVLVASAYYYFLQ
jgi:hypothetical protein